jgi:hypothetical protein
VRGAMLKYRQVSVAVSNSSLDDVGIALINGS